MRLMLLAMSLILAVPAAAQQPEWRTAREVDLLMRPFDYEPSTLRLQAGQPVRLRFLNQGQATYSLSAPDFFAAARIRSGDERQIEDGRIRLAPGEQKTVLLVPAPGRYRARSGNIVHRLLGMSALIVVE